MAAETLKCVLSAAIASTEISNLVRIAVAINHILHILQTVTFMFTFGVIFNWFLYCISRFYSNVVPRNPDAESVACFMISSGIDRCVKCTIFECNVCVSWTIRDLRLLKILCDTDTKLSNE